MSFWYIVLVSIIAIYYIRNFLKLKLFYFKNKGIQQLETKFVYGSAKEIINKKLYQGEFYKNVYNEFKKMGLKHGGIYLGSKPVWMPVDLDLIKTILIKDFSYFSARLEKDSNSMFFNSLFFMDGEEWKEMRKKLAPMFTSGKMKMMFNILLEKTNELSNVIDKTCMTGEPVNVKDMLDKFTIDVIGSCGFGIECNSLEDDNSEFFKIGQRIFEDTKESSKLELFLKFVGLRKTSINPDYSSIENFFWKILEDVITYREKNNIIRKDFLQLMIELKNKGAITELANENKDIFNETIDKELMSLDEIASQCTLFFTAGYETSSSTMTFALLELTQHQDIQEKMRNEIREVLRRHNGKLTYDNLQEMTYCDNVIHETLRKYSPAVVIPRVCTKDYRIPGTNTVIEKGTAVNISVWGLHMDPDYFPEPEKFIPDRFSDENNKIEDMTYLPFGEGPRTCLGIKFGIMQTKAGLVALINEYNFTLNTRTPYPAVYKKNFRFFGTAEGPIWVNATKVG